MDSLEVFKKLRDACDEIIKAIEGNDESQLEIALGKFMLLMIQLDCIK